MDAQPPSTPGPEDATLAGDTPTQGPFGGPARAMPSVPAPAGTPFGRYILQEAIGHGGMGVVYRAWDTALCRTVALKTLLPGASGREDAESQIARFLREARSAGRLQHPNVIAVFDVGQHEGRHFFTMELIDGLPLERWLAGDGRGDGPPGFIEAARLVEKAARALHAAHEQGIVHRDVKPSNLLVDARDEPHLGDFGLAKAVDLSTSADLTRSGALLGTPQYMSPEQAGGDPEALGAASDVYSLGAVLYYALTGSPPFTQPNLAALLRCVLEVDPEAPSRRNGKVPRDLEAICLKCLEKDPRRRYATAQELAEDLARYVAGVAVLARRRGPIGRALRSLRRHRALAAIVAVVLAGGVVAGVVVKNARGLSAQARASQEAEARRGRAQDLLASLPSKHELKSREALEAVLPRLSEAIACDPSFAAPWLLRGYVNDKLDRFDEAIADDAQAAAIDPWLAEAHYRRGVALLSRLERDVVGARTAFLAAENAQPGSLYAALGEARVAVLEEDFKKAQEVLDRLAKLPDRHPDVFFLRASIHSYVWSAQGMRDRTVPPEWLDLEAALADLDVALELDPISAWGRGVRGLVRFSVGDLEGAIDDLSESMRLRPRPDTAYAGARVAYLQGDPGTSRRFVDQAIALSPQAIYIRFRALLDFWERRYEHGLAEVDAVIAADPSETGTMFTRGILRFALGDREGAGEDIRAYRESRADVFDRFKDFDKQIAKNRAVLRTVATGFKDVDRILFLPPERKKQLRALQTMVGGMTWYKEAMDRLLEATRNEPDTAGLLLSLTGIVESREELSGLPAFLTKELALKNDFVFGIEGRFIAGMTQEATLLWRKRLSTSKEYIGRASARYRRGEVAQGLVDAEAAARLAPSDADALYALATLRALAGNPDEAMQALSQAFEAGWGHPEDTAIDPDFGAIKDRPEFRNLVGR